MKEKKRFVTLFPPAANVHLLKDVGMLPYILYRDYGYRSTLVCFRNEAAYPAVEREVKGLEIHFLPEEKNYAFGRISRQAVAYLRKQAKEIDVLNLYHNTQETLLYGFIYKLFNPRGVLYIKLDINIERFDAQKTQRVHAWRLKGYNWFFRQVADVVSCELPSAFDYLEEAIPSLRGKLLLLPNGIDDKAMEEQGVKPLPAGKKEKLIVAVGRIGAPEKNHEMLLRAAAQAGLGDWKIALVGPVDEAFGKWSESFLSSHPSVRDRVIFTGPIADRAELYGWYNRARVCCLTSRYESFGLVLVEALYFGNYLLTTPVPPATFLTDSERVGRIVRTEEELAEMLERIAGGAFDTEPFYEPARKYSERFRWSAILPRLDRALRTCLDLRKK
ncbi:MAG: glycosyltransferase family 4 protein [Parabacteroides sp.]|nr:glycosyltransferase family 4 protein [Parabacteroides sp.]